MQSVGLFEAWSLWWQGEKLDDVALYGIPMLAVGRLGKIVSFLASVVAVIDIIGPERIRAWGSRTRRTATKSVFARTIQLVAAGLMYVLVITMMFMIGILGEFPKSILVGMIPVLIVTALFFHLAWMKSFPQRAATVVGRALENDGWEPIIRWSAFMLIIAGFSLDLLAS